MIDIIAAAFGLGVLIAAVLVPFALLVIGTIWIIDRIM